MKKLKLITAFIALIFTTNVIYAQKPDSAKVKEMASQMVIKLNADVDLSKEQKEKVQINASKFIRKLQDTKSITDKKEMYVVRKRAFDEYNASLDSTFTVEQKSKYTTKARERKESSTKNKK